MALRRKINGKYYIIREKSSKNGRKGTIISLWHPSKHKLETKTEKPKRIQKPLKTTFLEWLLENDSRIDHVKRI